MASHLCQEGEQTLGVPPGQEGAKPAEPEPSQPHFSPWALFPCDFYVWRGRTYQGEDLRGRPSRVCLLLVSLKKKTSVNPAPCRVAQT